MNDSLKHAVWGQFGAAIDALESAIVACPDGVWGEGPTPQAFWYLAYHTLFWLDFYLAGTPEDFAPSGPFTLGELDPAGVYPDRTYTKAELQAYLEHARRKCRATIAAMTDEQSAKLSGFQRLGLSHAELLFYNLRHVQHHTGQINLLIRQAGGEPAPYVMRAGK